MSDPSYAFRGDTRLTSFLRQSSPFKLWEVTQRVLGRHGALDAGRRSASQGCKMASSGNAGICRWVRHVRNWQNIDEQCSIEGAGCT